MTYLADRYNRLAEGFTARSAAAPPDADGHTCMAILGRGTR